MRSILAILFLFLFPAFISSQSYCKQIKEYRKTYKEGFEKDERAPLKGKELENMRFFKPKKKYKVQCEVRLTPEEAPFDLPTYSGITRPYRKYAILSFEFDGISHELSIYQNLTYLRFPGRQNYLFLPYKDDTNAISTYGGGRYITLDASKIVNGKMYIDFNKSYNPWCAYSDGYNCPIPPKENHLAIGIKAGEKNYKGKYKSVQ